jgi:hypothetical protein
MKNSTRLWEYQHFYMAAFYQCQYTIYMEQPKNSKQHVISHSKSYKYKIHEAVHTHWLDWKVYSNWTETFNIERVWPDQLHKVLGNGGRLFPRKGVGMNWEMMELPTPTQNEIYWITSLDTPFISENW